MKLQSSVTGAIKKMLVVYNPGMEEIIVELAKKLNAHTQLIIIVGTKPAPLISQLNTNKITYVEKSNTNNCSSCKCIIVPIASKLSKWIRDAFIIVSDGNEIKAIESSNFEDAYNQLNRRGTLRALATSGSNSGITYVIPQNLSLAEILQKEKIINGIVKIDPGHPLTPDNWFVIDSGNILIDDDFIFLGGTQFKMLLSLFSESPDCETETKAIGLIDKLLNQDTQKKEIHILGYNSVCNLGNQAPISLPPGLIHIDLFITLTGVKKDGKYVLLIGQPMTEDCEIIEADEIEIEKIVDQINALGKFHVIRNPMPKIRQEYFFSYNNCLVEVIPNGAKTVWLPQFSYGDTRGERKIIDDKLCAIWKSLGFSVQFINADIHPFCRELGALHCLTNELLRK